MMKMVKGGSFLKLFRSFDNRVNGASDGAHKKWLIID